ncbi:hypothetical protein ES288_A09G167600v1 [Gossypium darwinii]|uniref:Uncharacterized protein n=1 Tax=Gossypium darwinii TaxID=34276 RepID=A0A5D2FDX1_GOSDA|nr:hypothetical protein ES288_A09G167600v1 [Gossypium darwinii]
MPLFGSWFTIPVIPSHLLPRFSSVPSSLCRFPCCFFFIALCPNLVIYRLHSRLQFISKEIHIHYRSTKPSIYKPYVIMFPFFFLNFGSLQDLFFLGF